ncbi:16S rRNA (guanine(966)-N(2))-methyltransferase RsmD [Desulfovibrio litoralis]|uniref:16S rRNA (Guanine966-N2)-methyltransferase n=1 Tax=Desulfovibrio litoralis DSM 11393 TaxID=1121455 RepID=A0A1M7TKJ7_9BACT|nr:16S rRNA (guanine(966)-N(2))-methyltransferase RsmD [Desulfovibrio litoralis]SHN71235.1 16S rRNA (guanine966-N2)-methyltransferase [Desulfovibrio litoralis DSM 11393]
MRILAGEFRGRKLKTVEALKIDGYRPAMSKVREALFSMLEARGIDWASTRALDLFAGSGSLAFESLSRGARDALCVESNPKAAALIQENARLLGLEQQRLQVANQDVGRFLGRKALASHDLIFIDPPYGSDYVLPCIKAILKQNWLSEQGFLTIELESRPAPGKGFNMDKVPSELTLEVDRNYGQTRVVIWTKQTHTP